MVNAMNNAMNDYTGRSILLVEDEAIIALDEKHMLERDGFRVRTVHSAADAIAAVDADGSIDLVLMDVDLGRGRMDGPEAARRLLERHDVPIVFLSNHTEPEVVASTEAITSYGYVVKDSGRTVLLASIKMAFRLHAANRRLRESTRRLSESERMFHELFDGMKEGVAIYRALRDGEDFEFVDLNQAGLTHGGKRREAVIGRPVTEVFPGIIEMGLLAVLRDVYLTGTPRRHPLVRYEHESLFLWVENYVFRLPSGLVVALYQDTTEQHTTEQYYRTIVQTAMEGFLIVDERGVLLDANDAYCRMSGYCHDELIGMTVPDIEAKESVAETRRHLDAILNAGGDRFESIHRRKDGSLLYLDASVTVHTLRGERRFVSFLRDITGQREAEQALRERAAHLTAAIQHSALVFAQTDRDGRYTWIANEHPDFDPGDVIGHRDEELSDSPGARELSALKDTVIAEETPRRAEIAFQLSDGPRVYDIVAEPLRDSTGAVVGVATCGRDITDRGLGPTSVATGS